MNNPQQFNLPGLSHQISITGRNGSGKTQMGAWLLSKARFDVQPFIIFDFKHDELLNDIDKAHDITLKDKLPKHPGIYRVHPVPGEEDEVEELLYKMWHHKNVGMYVDEMYMIDKYSKAMNTILTQGRSLMIPRYLLTQRPTNCSRFTFSECNFYSAFHLNDKRDMKILESFMPHNLNVRLPEYHSYYYDVNNDRKFMLKPVPDRDTILKNFDARLPHKRKGWF